MNLKKGIVLAILLRPIVPVVGASDPERVGLSGGGGGDVPSAHRSRSVLPEMVPQRLERPPAPVREDAGVRARAEGAGCMTHHAVARPRRVVTAQQNEVLSEAIGGFECCRCGMPIPESAFIIEAEEIIPLCLFREKEHFVVGWECPYCRHEVSL